MNQKQIDELKDILWFLKGYNKSEESPFGDNHTRSLLEAILLAQKIIGEQDG